MRTKNYVTAGVLLVFASGLAGCGEDIVSGPPAPTQPPVATSTVQPTSATKSVTPTASATPTGTTQASPTTTPGQPGAGRIVFGETDQSSFLSDIFTINLDGSDRTNLTKTSDASETQPSWSPDGLKVLFRVGDNTIAVMNDDGSGVTTVLTSDGPVYYPSWSPDGTKIVFVADEAIGTQGDNTIDVVNADGSGRSTIRSQKGDYLAPTYSPDGARIAFASNTGGTAIELFVMDSDGTNLTQITDEGATNEGPAWRPTGDDIAFSSPAATPGRADISLIRPNGTERRLLLAGAGGNVAWNRDGSRLTFDVFGEGISVLNADGTGLQQVPNTTEGFDPDLD